MKFLLNMNMPRTLGQPLGAHGHACRHAADIGLGRAGVRPLLAFAALARNVDRLGPDDDRVRVLTVHQAKGLEFEAVVVAGLSENEFPDFGSLKEGREVEERRLLYVALARARRHLILTGHAFHEGKRQAPSPYLKLLEDHVIEGGVDRPGGVGTGGPASLTAGLLAELRQGVEGSLSRFPGSPTAGGG